MLGTAAASFDNSSYVERRRVLDATITGLNTIGLAVVAMRSLSPEQTVYGVANTLSTALVVPVQVLGSGQLR